MRHLQIIIELPQFLFGFAVAQGVEVRIFGKVNRRGFERFRIRHLSGGAIGDCAGGGRRRWLSFRAFELPSHWLDRRLRHFEPNHRPLTGDNDTVSQHGGLDVSRPGSPFGSGQPRRGNRSGGWFGTSHRRADQRTIRAGALGIWNRSRRHSALAAWRLDRRRHERIGVVIRNILSATGLLHIVCDGLGKDPVQPDLLDNPGGHGLAQELVKVQPGESGLLLGCRNVALILTQLNFVVLLGICQICGRGLVLDFLLDDLLLEIGAVQFHQDLIGANVILGHKVALINDLEDLGPLIAHPDFAFDFL